MPLKVEVVVDDKSDVGWNVAWSVMRIMETSVIIVGDLEKEVVVGVGVVDDWHCRCRYLGQRFAKRRALPTYVEELPKLTVLVMTTFRLPS